MSGPAALAQGLTHHQRCRGSPSRPCFPFLFISAKLQTPDSFAASISLFFLPLTHVALLGTLPDALSTFPLIPARPFVGCCAVILVLFSAANKIARSARSSRFPPGPATFISPPSHPNQLGRPTFNQALRRRIPQSAYLMGCYRFFCQPKITHSGPMYSRQTALSGHSSKQQPPLPPLLLHRNSFLGKKHSIQCIGPFALQPTTIN